MTLCNAIYHWGEVSTYIYTHTHTLSITYSLTPPFFIFFPFCCEPLVSFYISPSFPLVLFAVFFLHLLMAGDDSVINFVIGIFVSLGNAAITCICVPPIATILNTIYIHRRFILGCSWVEPPEAGSC